MKRTFLLKIVAVAVAVPFTPLISQPASEHAGAAHQGLYKPDAMQWESGPESLPAGAKIAVLEGDPKKEGFFLMRLRFPDGYHIPGHTHPKTERVTVISGTFKLAMGEKLDTPTHVLPAGSYGFWPAGMKHAAWAEGETEIQIHGVGPWVINYLNPADDPRNAGKGQ